MSHRRQTARERALPGLIAEANRRLAAIDAVPSDDPGGIDEACSYLAQHVRRDVQPDWDAYPRATGRYDRLKFRRLGIDAPECR